MRAFEGYIPLLVRPTGQITGVARTKLEAKSGRLQQYCHCLCESQVPPGVRFCTVKTEEPADTDVGCILLCPRNSEAEFALSLVRKVLRNTVDVAVEDGESLLEWLMIFASMTLHIDQTCRGLCLHALLTSPFPCDVPPT